jgi:hypothetical protein
LPISLQTKYPTQAYRMIRQSSQIRKHKLPEIFGRRRIAPPLFVSTKFSGRSA